MNKIVVLIKDFFWNLLFIFIWGIVGGLAMFMAILFTRHAFIWALLVTGFFSLFHLSNLRRFFIERNWLAFFGRLSCLYVISAFIAGLVAFAGELLEIKFDLLNFIIFVLSMILSLSFVAFWTILEKYFSHTRFYQNIQKTIDGLRAIGMLWS